MENNIKIIETLQTAIAEGMINIVLSNPKKQLDQKTILPEINQNELIKKITIKKILLKKQTIYQTSFYVNKKVIHKNFSQKEIMDFTTELMSFFKEAQIFTAKNNYHILTSKKDKISILKHAASENAAAEPLTHNRTKNYIISETEPCSFLERLGVMNAEGKVLAQKYDKFKQLNRFLEFVRDIEDNFKGKDTINIVDFGCGKSYLTFAIYHYFVNILHRKVNIIGLDLKQDVIDNCNEIAKDLNFSDLKFIAGDIKGFDENSNGFHTIDMVVMLHACDTATDEGLYKALKWNAKVIMAVPCCQHELAKVINNDLMKPMQKFGIINERLSALITDSVRANVLEIMGYSVQILEFIDMEHTPKNLMIRAVKTKAPYSDAGLVKKYDEFKKFWGISPYIDKVFNKD